MRFLLGSEGGRPLRRLGGGDCRLSAVAGGRDAGRRGSRDGSRVCMDGRGGRDGSRRAVVVDVLSNGGVDAGTEVPLDEAGADAKDVAERATIPGITPALGTRLVSTGGHGLEVVGAELILCSDAMMFSAATLPALPGLCVSMTASPDALRAVLGVGALGVTLVDVRAGAETAAVTVTAAAIRGG